MFRRYVLLFNNIDIEITMDYFIITIYYNKQREYMITSNKMSHLEII